MNQEADLTSSSGLRRSKRGSVETATRVLRSRTEQLVGSPSVRGGTPKRESISNLVVNSPKKTPRKTNVASSETPKSKTRASSVEPSTTPVRRISTRRSSSVQPNSPTKNEVDVNKRLKSSISENVASPLSTRSRRSSILPSLNSPASSSTNLEPIKEIRKLNRKSVSSAPIENQSTVKSSLPRRSSLLKSNTKSPSTSPGEASTKSEMQLKISNDSSQSRCLSPVVECVQDVLNANLVVSSSDKSGEVKTNSGTESLPNKDMLKEDNINLNTIDCVQVKSPNTSQAESSLLNKNKSEKSNYLQSLGILKECEVKLLTSDCIKVETVTHCVKSEVTSPNLSLSQGKNESCNDSEDSGIKEMEGGQHTVTVDSKQVLTKSFVSEEFEDQNNDPNAKSISDVSNKFLDKENHQSLYQSNVNSGLKVQNENVVCTLTDEQKGKIEASSCLGNKSYIKQDNACATPPPDSLGEKEETGVSTVNHLKTATSEVDQTKSVSSNDPQNKLAISCDSNTENSTESIKIKNPLIKASSDCSKNVSLTETLITEILEDSKTKLKEDNDSLHKDSRKSPNNATKISQTSLKFDNEGNKSKSDEANLSSDNIKKLCDSNENKENDFKLEIDNSCDEYGTEENDISTEATSKDVLFSGSSTSKQSNEEIGSEKTVKTKNESTFLDLSSTISQTDADETIKCVESGNKYVVTSTPFVQKINTLNKDNNSGGSEKVSDDSQVMENYSLIVNCSNVSETNISQNKTLNCDLSTEYSIAGSSSDNSKLNVISKTVKMDDSDSLDFKLSKSGVERVVSSDDANSKNNELPRLSKSTSSEVTTTIKIENINAEKSENELSNENIQLENSIVSETSSEKKKDQDVTMNTLQGPKSPLVEKMLDSINDNKQCQFDVEITVIEKANELESSYTNEVNLIRFDKPEQMDHSSSSRYSLVDVKDDSVTMDCQYEKKHSFFPSDTAMSGEKQLGKDSNKSCSNISYKDESSGSKKSFFKLDDSRDSSCQISSNVSCKLNESSESSQMPSNISKLDNSCDYSIHLPSKESELNESSDTSQMPSKKSELNKKSSESSQMPSNISKLDNSCDSSIHLPSKKSELNESSDTSQLPIKKSELNESSESFQMPSNVSKLDNSCESSIQLPSKKSALNESSDSSQVPSNISKLDNTCDSSIQFLSKTFELNENSAENTDDSSTEEASSSDLTILYNKKSYVNNCRNKLNVDVSTDNCGNISSEIATRRSLRNLSKNSITKMSSELLPLRLSEGDDRSFDSSDSEFNPEQVDEEESSSDESSDNDASLLYEKYFCLDEDEKRFESSSSDSDFVIDQAEEESDSSSSDESNSALSSSIESAESSFSSDDQDKLSYSDGNDSTSRPRNPFIDDEAEEEEESSEDSTTSSEGNNDVVHIRGNAVKPRAEKDFCNTCGQSSGMKGASNKMCVASHSINCFNSAVNKKTSKSEKLAAEPVQNKVKGNLLLGPKKKVNTSVFVETSASKFQVVEQILKPIQESSVKFCHGSQFCLKKRSHSEMIGSNKMTSIGSTYNVVPIKRIKSSEKVVEKIQNIEKKNKLKGKLSNNLVQQSKPVCSLSTSHPTTDVPTVARDSKKRKLDKTLDQESNVANQLKEIKSKKPKLVNKKASTTRVRSGKKIKKTTKSRRRFYTANIENLSYRVNALKLIKFFSKQGVDDGIEAINLSKCSPRDFCLRKGYGTISFSSEESMQKLIDASRTLKLNGENLWIKPSEEYRPSSKQCLEWLEESNRLYHELQCSS